MKKIFTLLLAFVMLLSLAACGSGSGFMRGETADTVYTNEAMGVSFTAPDGYIFYTDEQIASFYGATAEVLNANSAIIYDMQCGNPATNGSISITFENLTALYGSAISDDSYLALTTASLRSSFNSTEGVILSRLDQDVIELDGVEYSCVYVTLKVNGTEFYETIVIKEQNGYMMECTVAAYDEAEMNSLLNALDIA